jgi:hypothetical protein
MIDTVLFALYFDANCVKKKGKKLLSPHIAIAIIAIIADFETVPEGGDRP